jgi:hypothetical protein
MPTDQWFDLMVDNSFPALLSQSPTCSPESFMKNAFADIGGRLVELGRYESVGHYTNEFITRRFKGTTWVEKWLGPKVNSVHFLEADTDVQATAIGLYAGQLETHAGWKTGTRQSIKDFVMKLKA